METKVFKCTILLCCCLNISLFAQTKQEGFCNNTIAKSIDFNNLKYNKLYTEYNQNSDTLNINIINTTADTVYLFKSYFAEDLYSSKYLHWLDKKQKQYIISFIPIISNLATKKSDRIISGENSISIKSQILYSFIQLNPNTYFTINLNINELFKGNIAVLSQDYKLLNKFNEAKFKPISTDRLKKNIIWCFLLDYTKMFILYVNNQITI